MVLYFVLFYLIFILIYYLPSIYLCMILFTDREGAPFGNSHVSFFHRACFVIEDKEMNEMLTELAGLMNLQLAPVPDKSQ